MLWEKLNVPDCERLLPPAQVIHERLTRNQRERRLLRALLRLAIDAKEIDHQETHQPHQEAAPREVDHAS